MDACPSERRRALAGIVGNAPSPDAALNVLSIPLLVCGGGLALGALSARLFVEADQNLSALLLQSHLTQTELAVLEAELAELEHEVSAAGPAGPMDERRAALIGQLEANRSQMEASKAKNDDTLKAAKAWVQRVRWSNHAGLAGTAALAGAFVTLIVGHAVGCIHLEKF